MTRARSCSDTDVLSAIERWIVAHGLPPTIEELRKVLGVGSTRTVLRYLETLEEAGQIERWPGARGLRLLRAPLSGGVKTTSVPIVGRVPAGALMVAETNIEGFVRLPNELLKPDGAKYFLLRVRGNSMNLADVGGDRIEDGDLVLVRKQPTANNGDVIVALVDGEATIKELSKAPGYIVLKPRSSDPKHQPIVVHKQIASQGVVRHVFKRGSELVSFETEE